MATFFTLFHCLSPFFHFTATALLDRSDELNQPSPFKIAHIIVSLCQPNAPTSLACSLLLCNGGMVLGPMTSPLPLHLGCVPNRITCLSFPVFISVLLPKLTICLHFPILSSPYLHLKLFTSSPHIFPFSHSHLLSQNTTDTPCLRILIQHIFSLLHISLDPFYVMQSIFDLLMVSISSFIHTDTIPLKPTTTLSRTFIDMPSMTPTPCRVHSCVKPPPALPSSMFNTI